MINIIIQWSTNPQAQSSILGIQAELETQGISTYIINDGEHLHLSFETLEDQFRYVLISPLKNNFHRDDFREVRYED